MKRLYSLFGLLFTALMAHGQTVFLTEHFNYLTESLLQDNGWNGHSAPTTNPIRVTDGGLTWTTTLYRGGGIGNAAIVNNNGSDENLPFQSYPSSGNVYASFLVKISGTVTAANEGFFFHLGQYTNIATPDFTNISSNFRARTFVTVGSSSAHYKIGLAFNATAIPTGANASADLDTGVTYLVVVKYSMIAGASNDNVSLYIFSDGDDISAEPITPTVGPLGATASATDISSVQYIALRQYATNPNIIIDGIVAQDSWDMLRSTNTWNGTAWSAGQAPNGENAIISGNLTTNSAITAFNLTVNNAINLNLGATQSFQAWGVTTNDGQIDINNGTLTLAGSYVGTGNIRSNGGIISLIGAGNLGALSFDQTTDGTTNVLANLTINRSNNGTASLANKLNITGNLTLTAGTLTTNGNLHLKSTSATAVAQVIGGTNANLNGNVTAERFLPWTSANNNGFRFVSHPLRTAPVINTVGNLPTANNTLISFNEAANAYEGLNDRTQSWTQGTGFGVWTNAINTLSFTGELQLSDLNSISMSNSTDRYNLVGNPFPSVIDWEAVNTTDMEDAVWTWVKDNTAEGSGAWASYVNGVGANGGTQYIAPMQGFMVRAASSGSPAIAFPAAARVTGQSPTFNRTSSLGDILRVSIQKPGSTSMLETVIRFHEDGNPLFDTRYDAGYLSDYENSSPDLYTTDASGNKYSINSLPEIGADPVQVPLQIETFGPGNFTLTFDASEFDTRTSIQLEDTRLGTFTPISTGQTVAFTAGVNDVNNRFYLHFNSLTTSVAANAFDQIQLYAHEGSLYVKGIEQAEQIRILDISGRLVYQLRSPQFDGNPIRTQLPSGNYIVQLIGKQSVKTVKVHF